MPVATRTFRVFVSSTFEDLKAERDALQRDVFPKLRKLCEENGARFQAVDLRWGVRDEAALDQQTMEICLREIERCQQTGIKPNFIVLLGDRYGWRPLPARIEAEEYHSLCSQIGAESDQRLVAEWYERDDNAIPAEYLLKPRMGHYSDQAHWEPVEQGLHRTLREAARRAGLSADLLVKYEASATHQEIIKGLGQTDHDRRHVFAFFREPSPGIIEDPDLKALKDELTDKLGRDNIRSFPASDFAGLCTAVEELLSAVITAESGTFKSRAALDLEVEAHNSFAHDRARFFIGRKRVLEEVDMHIRSNESQPVVVRGPSGCGKSAIIAKASEQAESNHPNAVLMQRFIGITPDSSTGITLLRSLCEQLSKEYDIAEETPTDFDPLVVAFNTRIEKATAERPLILFLDALDQLSSDDQAASFEWLRKALPPNVSFVFTTTARPPGLKQALQIEVEAFSTTEAEEVLATWLANAHRRLQTEQVEKVLTGFVPSGLPLYLKMAFEEARRWHSFQETSLCVLGNDIRSMINVLFKRLAQESNHGPIMVDRSLGYLAAARYGLTEDEILDILAADDEVWKDFESRAHHVPPERRLPVIVWSRLLSDIEPYLSVRAVQGGTVMAFYHRQVAESVGSSFLVEPSGRLRHLGIASYFGKQILGARRVTEEPWQLAEVGDWDHLFTVLENLNFARAIFTQQRQDLLRYWSRLEKGTAFRVGTAYHHVIENPGHSRRDLNWIKDLLEVEGDRENLLKLLEGREHLARANSDMPELLECLADLAVMYFHKSSGQPLEITTDVSTLNQQKPMQLLREHEAIARSIGDNFKLQEGIGTQAQILIWSGQYWLARDQLTRQEKLCRQIGDKRGLARCLGNLGYVHNLLSEEPDAIAYYERAENACRESGDLVLLTEILDGHGEVYKDLSRPYEAIALWQEEARLASEFGFNRILRLALGKLDQTYSYLGADEAALLLLEREEKLCIDLGDLEQLRSCKERRVTVSSSSPSVDSARPVMKAFPTYYDEPRRLGIIAVLKTIADGESRFLPNAAVISDLKLHILRYLIFDLLLDPSRQSDLSRVSEAEYRKRCQLTVELITPLAEALYRNKDFLAAITPDIEFRQFLRHIGSRLLYEVMPPLGFTQEQRNRATMPLMRCALLLMGDPTTR